MSSAPFDILEELRMRIASRSAAPLAELLNCSLSRREAAAYLACHPKTLAKMTTDSPSPKDGQVTGYRDGGRWKYRLSDLEAYRDRLAGSTPRQAARRKDIDWSL